MFYRGPLGRLANLAKSETLLKYCINKKIKTHSKKTANPWEEAFWFHLFLPRSCTEMVTENRYKPISCDESDSLVHIHKDLNRL